MKVILKIVFAPVIAALAIIIWIFALTLSLSAWVFGVLGTVFGILGLITLLFINTTNGIIILVFAFSSVPWGFRCWQRGRLDRCKDSVTSCRMQFTDNTTSDQFGRKQKGRVWLRRYSSIYIEGGE